MVRFWPSFYHDSILNKRVFLLPRMCCRNHFKILSIWLWERTAPLRINTPLRTVYNLNYFWGKCMVASGLNERVRMLNAYLPMYQLVLCQPVWLIIQLRYGLLLFVIRYLEQQYSVLLREKNFERIFAFNSYHYESDKLIKYTASKLSLKM